MRIADCKAALRLWEKVGQINRALGVIERDGVCDLADYNLFHKRGSEVFQAVHDHLVAKKAELTSEMESLGIEFGLSDMGVPLGEAPAAEAVFDVAKTQAVDPPVLPQAYGTM